MQVEPRAVDLRDHRLVELRAPDQLRCQPDGPQVGGAESPQPTGLTGACGAEGCQPEGPQIGGAESPQPSGLTVIRDAWRAIAEIIYRGTGYEPCAP